MNAVFLASTLRLGGAERVTGEISERLAAHGIRVTWALLREPGAEGERLKRAGADLVSGLGPTRWLPFGAVRLLSFLRERKADALYCLDHQNAVVSGVMAADAAGVPRRYLAVHTTGLWGGRASLPAGIRAALPRLTRVVAVAEGQARYLAEVEKVPAEKIAVIRNGIDLGRFRADDARRARGLKLRAEILDGAPGPLIGVVAALRPEKGHDVLLHALAHLRPTLPGVRVAFAGDGPLRRDLEDRAAGLGVPGPVRFLGARDDVADLLQAFDLVALPSHAAVETLPLSIMEAMAAGRAVVATRVGSVSELVDEGSTGLLVPPGDAAGLAAALLRLLSDRILRESFGRAAVTRSREFDIATTVERTAALLRGEPV